MLESWVQPFEREFGKDSRFAFYEIPMLNSAWVVRSWMIDSGMRSGIPVEKHGRVATYYGDYSGYQEALGMVDTNLAYVFLLDKKGIVRWKEQWYANPVSSLNFMDTIPGEI